MYELEYLTVAKRDMVEIARYISHDLANPAAAIRLAQEMVDAAERLRRFPYVNAVHSTVMPLKHEYRKQIVQNYLMLYWVYERSRCVVFSRVMYARRDYERLMPFLNITVETPEKDK